jgi:hypothetical protein
MFYRRTLWPALIVAAAVLTGCSDQYAGRKAVSGRVILEGQPLPGGSITFIPLDHQGTQSGALIVNGDYKLPRKDGLQPGKYLVQITAGDSVTPTNESEAGAPGGSRNIVSVDLIPEDWNVRPTHQVEVKPDGDNTFDFDIPKANTPKRGR